MVTWTTILILIGLAFLSGVLGRMGGAGKSGQWYDGLLDTKWRDIGCSLIWVTVVGILLNWAGPWWAYALTFGLTWASFCTYWDKLFGYDNLWFSGLVVGFAGFPILFIDINLWQICVARALILMILWGCLNRFLPQRGILIWRRDVAEEFLRYFVSL